MLPAIAGITDSQPLRQAQQQRSAAAEPPLSKGGGSVLLF
jgi:hypothetical protein